MKTTANIPRDMRECPIKNELDFKEITEWMATRPEHELDTCINRMCRWTYIITDHGVWTDITVVDNTDKTEFKVGKDMENW